MFFQPSVSHTWFGVVLFTCISAVFFVVSVVISFPEPTTKWVSHGILALVRCLYCATTIWTVHADFFRMFRLPRTPVSSMNQANLAGLPCYAGLESRWREFKTNSGGLLVQASGATNRRNKPQIILPLRSKPIAWQSTNLSRFWRLNTSKEYIPKQQLVISSLRRELIVFGLFVSANGKHAKL